jgi:ankyrin repeat protein
MLWYSLLENGAEINVQDNFGQTPLHFVTLKRKESSYSKFDDMKFLLKNGSNINTSNKIGETSLHILSAIGTKSHILLL